MIIRLLLCNAYAYDDNVQMLTVIIMLIILLVAMIICLLLRVLLFKLLCLL